MLGQSRLINELLVKFLYVAADGKSNKNINCAKKCFLLSFANVKNLYKNNWKIKVQDGI